MSSRHRCCTQPGQQGFSKEKMAREHQKQQVPRLRTATKKEISRDSTIFIFKSFGKLIVWVWFGIVENLAVDVLFGVSIINKHIWGILHSKRKVVPWHSSLGPILSRNSSEALKHHMGEQDWKLWFRLINLFASQFSRRLLNCSR